MHKKTMMLTLPYGNRRINIQLPRERIAAVLEVKEGLRDGEPRLMDAIENPMNSPTLTEFVEKSDNLLLVVNDGTRPTPTAQVIHSIFPQLKEKLKEGKVKVIVATGTHRAPTEGEYRFIFGRYLPFFKGHIFSHNSRKDRMKEYGITSRGTPVLINCSLEKADGIITVGSVEPHYFAGYTGGRKSIVPGVAGFKTIENNHSFALSTDAQALKLDGNPVHQDLEEAVGYFLDSGKRVFSIQTVVDKHHEIYSAYAGHLKDSFYEAVKDAAKVFSIPLKERADIVITAAAPPMDLNLYQSQKALEHGRLALNSGGIIILVSPCFRGVGNDIFLRLMEMAGSPERVMETVRKNYRLGYHKSARLASLVLDSQVWAYTSLTDSVLRKAFIKPVHDLQGAVELALKMKDEGKVVVMPEGSITVPAMNR